MEGSPQEVQAAIEQRIKEFKQKFMEESLRRVKQRTPVASGTLQDSWEGEVTDKAITISSDVDYASYVEFGTEKMAPAAMLRLTAEEGQQIADEIAGRLQ